MLNSTLHRAMSQRDNKRKTPHHNMTNMKVASRKTSQKLKSQFRTARRHTTKQNKSNTSVKMWEINNCVAINYNKKMFIE